MSSSQTKSLFKFHLIGMVTVLIGLLGLVFYQLFVLPNYTAIAVKDFFKISTLKKAFYQPLDPGKPQNFPEPNLLAVVCQPDCVFHYQDLKLPAQVDNDPQAHVTGVTLRFFDPQQGLNPQQGLIGYQNQKTDNPTFFVLDLSGRLLQTIRLNLNQQRVLSFINYYPQSKEILFQSVNQTNGQIQHWFYSATQPSLRSVKL